MTEELPATQLIKHYAELVLDSSIVGKNNFLKLFRELRPTETLANLKLEGWQQTEILCAELFLAQLPLQKFLGESNDEKYLDNFYRDIYKLLKERYGYFPSDEALILLEVLMQQRFPEYFQIREVASKSNEKGLVELLTVRVVSNLNLPKVLNLFLPFILSSRILTLDDFLKEISEKHRNQINWEK